MSNVTEIIEQYKNCVNAEVILAYTNAMYSVDKEFIPEYNEYRDMWSTGQIASKLWAIAELNNLGIMKDVETVSIAGAWYGSLAMMMTQQFGTKHKYTLLDLDYRCKYFLDSICYHYPHINATIQDMYDCSFVDDLVINTSCEHIPQLKEWVDLINDESIILLQSNNADNIDGHISCVQSVEEFKEKSGLSTIMFEGELDIPYVYTRYMLIGKKS